MRSESVTPKSPDSMPFEREEYETSSVDLGNGRRGRPSAPAFCNRHLREPPLPLATESSNEEIFLDVEFGDYPLKPISRQVEGSSMSGRDWEGLGNLDEGKKLYQEEWNLRFSDPTETSISQGLEHNY